MFPINQLIAFSVKKNMVGCLVSSPGRQILTQQKGCSFKCLQPRTIEQNSKIFERKAANVLLGKVE